MNGVHDMGGMHGFGPVVREVDEPLFHAPWEARIRGMAELAIDNLFTIDAFRSGIERMDPAQYLGSSYYERWLATVESNLVHEGMLTGDELEARIALLRQHPDVSFPPAGAAPRAHAPAIDVDTPAAAPSPRFAVGDAVVTRNVHPTGHTRLPRYARGKRGTIQRLHGTQTFPDTNAHGLGKQPQPLYAVQFDARELWGETAEPRQTVSLDLWESYLEPALA
jgi:nitrile hydratase